MFVSLKRIESMQTLYVINQMIIIGFLLILSGYCCSQGDYYSPTVHQCLPCQSGCQVCSSSSNCLACSSGLYLSASNCYSCQISCSTCLNMATCTSCSNGFYLNSSSSTCQLCSTNCLQCDSNSCKQCNTGFYPNGKDCHSCEVSCDCSSGTLQNCPAITSSMLIVIIVIPIVGTSAIVLICCICYRKFHQKQQNPQERKTPSAEDSTSSISYGLKLIGVLLNMKKKNWSINEEGEKIDKEQICSICLHKKVNLKTKCKHHFHMKCLCKWLQQNPTCPMCKTSCNKQLRKYCLLCRKSFIQFNFKEASKYNSSIFDVCPYCQTLHQTQHQFI